GRDRRDPGGDQGCSAGHGRPPAGADRDRAGADVVDGASDGRHGDQSEDRQRPRVMARSGERGAGDGNRTHVTSLEGWRTTIVLRPRREPVGARRAGNYSTESRLRLSNISGTICPTSSAKS